MTFSLFHVLTFVRSTVIPMAFPSNTPSSANGQQASPTTPPLPKRIGTMIQSWVKTNYDPAMRFVAYSEVAIFLRLLGGVFLWRNGLIAPLIYAHFLRLRFYMSSFTRAAFTHVGDVLDNATKDQRCPPAVRKGYLTAKDLVRTDDQLAQRNRILTWNHSQISRYASSVLSVQNQGPAAGPSSATATPNASAASPAAAGTSPRA